jgi:hypothetical protein
MSTQPAALLAQSRFQVVTAGEPALTMDDKDTLHLFDGFIFSRRRRRDFAFSVVPSWQTPRHGWLFAADCPCAALIVPPEADALESGLTSSLVAA